MDLAAHCINDVLCCGADPLFLLDYVAAEHIDPEQVAELVEGAAEVCREAGCALGAGLVLAVDDCVHAGGETGDALADDVPVEAELAAEVVVERPARDVEALGYCPRENFDIGGKQRPRAASSLCDGFDGTIRHT